MKLERAKPEDGHELVEWMTANLALNDCSPRTLKGCLFYKIDGVLYLPVKPMLMLESLAPNPDVTGTKRLLALRRALNELRQLYPGTELIFMTKGNSALDQGARIYGFEEAPYRVYRLIDYASGRAKSKQRKKALAQVRLRNITGTDGVHEAGATRHVPGMSNAACERQSQEPAGARPHQGHEDDSRHIAQSLQSRVGSCARRSTTAAEGG